MPRGTLCRSLQTKMRRQEKRKRQVKCSHALSNMKFLRTKTTDGGCHFSSHSTSSLGEELLNCRSGKFDDTYVTRVIPHGGATFASSEILSGDMFHSFLPSYVEFVDLQPRVRDGGPEKSGGKRRRREGRMYRALIQVFP